MWKTFLRRPGQSTWVSATRPLGAPALLPALALYATGCSCEGPSLLASDSGGSGYLTDSPLDSGVSTDDTGTSDSGPSTPAGFVPPDALCEDTGAADPIDTHEWTDTANPTPVADPFGCGGGVRALIGAIPYASLADALGDAIDGDTVEVCPGVHRGGFVVTVQDLTIRGAAGEAATTVLTGALSERVVDAPEGGRLTLQDLTIRRGYSAGRHGGGVRALRAASVTVERCSFVENVSCTRGGGLYADSPDGLPIILRDVDFVGNYAAYGGGAAALGFYYYPADIAVTDAVFIDNAAGYVGGALWLNGDGGDVSVVEATFTANHAGSEGGGIGYGSFFVPTLSVADSTFDGNTSGGNGAAVDLGSWVPYDVVFARCAFRGNVASVGGGGIHAGGWEGGTLTVEDSAFDGNVSDVLGAAITFYTFPNGTPEVLNIFGGSITSNVSASPWGAAVGVGGETWIYADNVDFGTGATDNAPHDVDWCVYPYGAGTTFVYDPYAQVCL